MRCILAPTDVAGIYACTLCGRKNPRPTDNPPHRVVMSCRAVPKSELTATGKLLASMKPGDGVKWLAEHTGLSWFVDPAKCGCKNRQAWLNRQWQRFVEAKFSESNASPPQ